VRGGPSLHRSADVDIVRETISGVVDVLLRPGLQGGALLWRECADDFCGRTHYEGAGRNFCELRYESVGADERLRADLSAVEDRRAHADEAFVADGAGVDNRAVADGDPITDEAWKFIGEMQDGVVLNVGVMADDDAIDVAAQDGVIPDAGMIAEGNVAKDNGGARDVNAGAEGGFAAQKSIQLLIQFAVAHEKEKPGRSRERPGNSVGSSRGLPTNLNYLSAPVGAAMAVVVTVTMTVVAVAEAKANSEAYDRARRVVYWGGRVINRSGRVDHCGLLIDHGGRGLHDDGLRLRNGGRVRN
jgi:hypothetical protein